MPTDVIGYACESQTRTKSLWKGYRGPIWARARVWAGCAAPRLPAAV